MEVVKMESRIWGTFFQGIEMKPKSQSWVSLYALLLMYVSLLTLQVPFLCL